jgi:CrcB protein
MQFVFISLFGLLGVFSRYWIGVLWSQNFPSYFPYGTLFINILGSVLIGIFHVLGVEKQLYSQSLHLGIVVGFLGGFTTFSSYALEVTRLVQMARYGYAFSYWMFSSILGFGGVFLGMIIVRSLIQTQN